MAGEAWEPFARILTVLYNVNRDPNSPPTTYNEQNPILFEPVEEKPIYFIKIDDLRRMTGGKLR
jgi:hypothetical protein